MQAFFGLSVLLTSELNVKECDPEFRFVRRAGATKAKCIPIAWLKKNFRF